MNFPTAPRRPTGTPTSLITVDLENLVGGSFKPADDCRTALAAIARAAAPRPGDFAFVGANQHLLAKAAFDCPFACRLVVAHPGPDGAERALMERTPCAWAAGRFDRLVIGSGDHAFIPLAEAALEAGREVLVVARRRSIARSFRTLGCTVRHLDQYVPTRPADSGASVIPFPLRGDGPDEPPGVIAAAA